MAVENAPRSVAPAGSRRTSRPRFPFRPRSGRVTGWGQVLATGFAVAVVAGAGQLGVAYGLGLLRLTRSFPSDGLWSTQLTWAAWFALGAVLAGAAGGRLAAGHRGLSLALGGRIAVGAAAGLGAAVLIPLTAIPARAAQLPERPGGLTASTPVLEICLAAGLGVLVGAALAVIALTVRLVAVSMILMAGLTWLLALISLAPALASGTAAPLVRLAVLDLPAVRGAQPALAVLTSPVLALLVCGAIALAARSRGLPPLQTAAATAAAPGLVALAYLIGSPGSGEHAVQTSPYAGSLLSVAAGLLVALLIGVIRPPTEPATAAAEAAPEAPTEELPVAASPEFESPGTEPLEFGAPGAGSSEFGSPGTERPGLSSEDPLLFPPMEPPSLSSEEPPPPPPPAGDLPVAGRPPSGGLTASIGPNVEPPTWAVAPETTTDARAADPYPGGPYPGSSGTGGPDPGDPHPVDPGIDSTTAAPPTGADLTLAAPAEQPRRMRKPLFGRRKKRRRPAAPESQSAPATAADPSDPLPQPEPAQEPEPTWQPESILETGSAAGPEPALEGELLPAPTPEPPAAPGRATDRLDPQTLDLDSLDLDSFMSRAREFTSTADRSSATPADPEPTGTPSASAEPFHAESSYSRPSYPEPVLPEPVAPEPVAPEPVAPEPSEPEFSPAPPVEDSSDTPAPDPDTGTIGKHRSGKHAKPAKAPKRRKPRSKPTAAEPAAPAVEPAPETDPDPAPAGKPAGKKADPEDEHISWISSLSTDPAPEQPDRAADAADRRRLRRDPD